MRKDLNINIKHQNYSRESRFTTPLARSLLDLHETRERKRENEKKKNDRSINLDIHLTIAI